MSVQSLSKSCIRPRYTHNSRELPENRWIFFSQFLERICEKRIYVQTLFRKSPSAEAIGLCSNEVYGLEIVVIGTME